MEIAALRYRRKAARVRVQEVQLILQLQLKSSSDQNHVKLEIKKTQLIWRVTKPFYWTTSQMLKSRDLKAESSPKMMLGRKDTNKLTKSSWMKRMVCSSSGVGPMLLEHQEKTWSIKWNVMLRCKRSNPYRWSLRRAKIWEVSHRLETWGSRNL